MSSPPRKPSGSYRDTKNGSDSDSSSSSSGSKGKLPDHLDLEPRNFQFRQTFMQQFSNPPGGPSQSTIGGPSSIPRSSAGSLNVEQLAALRARHAARMAEAAARQQISDQTQRDVNDLLETARRSQAQTTANAALQTLQASTSQRSASPAPTQTFTRAGTPAKRSASPAPAQIFIRAGTPANAALQTSQASTLQRSASPAPTQIFTRAGTPAKRSASPAPAQTFIRAGTPANAANEPTIDNAADGTLITILRRSPEPRNSPEAAQATSTNTPPHETQATRTSPSPKPAPKPAPRPRGRPKKTAIPGNPPPPRRSQPRQGLRSLSTTRSTRSQNPTLFDFGALDRLAQGRRIRMRAARERKAREAGKGGNN